MVENSVYLLVEVKVSDEDIQEPIHELAAAIEEYYIAADISEDDFRILGIYSGRKPSWPSEGLLDRAVKSPNAMIPHKLAIRLASLFLPA